MDDILKRYLKKQGVKDVKELTAEERATFNEWQGILSAETTILDVGKHVAGEITRLNKELREAVKRGEDRIALLITGRLENYEAILILIEAPAKARKELREALASQF